MTAQPAPGHSRRLVREKPLPSREGDALLGGPGSSERPPSIRDAIIRWLNEEL